MMSARQHTTAFALLDQQDHSPVAGQVGGDGLQGFVQQLIQVQRGAEDYTDLMEGCQLREFLIERDVRELQVRVGLLKLVKLLLRAVARLQQQALRIFLRVGKPSGAPQDPTTPGREQGCDRRRPFPSRQPPQRVDQQSR